MSEPREIDTDGSLARVLELAKGGKDEDPNQAVHQVIDQCLLSMVFQPIVDLKSGQIFAYEALCRSRLPQFEGPESLIEAAAAVGRIGELGRLQRRLASKNCPDWPIFVNISPHEFDEGFLVRPDDAIFGHRKPVYIEITESVPLVFFEQCHSVLAELRRKGAHLAIDDLGAGYSNLKYIADLAPDIVKLDRDLVAGCTMAGTQYELLCSIAKLCREVNAQVVAEGVENSEELEAVSSAGIEYCQGFFLGRPKISPSELSWPASELITSDGFKVRRAAKAADRRDDLPEDADRRLEELEQVRSILEKSVRKARGEVVRLRKALTQAEGKSERANVRLTEVEDALTESETNRLRLARLFEAATLKSQPSEEAKPEEKGQSSAPTFRRLAIIAVIWTAGVLAGLALYKLGPWAEESSERAEPAAVAIRSPAPIASAAEAVTTPPAAAHEIAAPPSVAEPNAQTKVEEPVAAAGATAVAEEPVLSPEAVASAEIRGLILDWAEAWSSRDLELYVAHYSDQFVADDGLSGEAWRAQRRDRLTRPSYISVSADQLDIRVESETTAHAVFQQTYSSDNFTDRVMKSFDLVREDNGWRIHRESVVE